MEPQLNVPLLPRLKIWSLLCVCVPWSASGIFSCSHTHTKSTHMFAQWAIAQLVRSYVKSTANALSAHSARDHKCHVAAPHVLVCVASTLHTSCCTSFSRATVDRWASLLISISFLKHIAADAVWQHGDLSGWCYGLSVSLSLSHSHPHCFCFSS